MPKLWEIFVKNRDYESTIYVVGDTYYILTDDNNCKIENIKEIFIARHPDLVISNLVSIRELNILDHLMWYETQ